MAEQSNMASAETSLSAGTSKSDKMDRLRNLQLRMNEARKMNHQEVVEEDRRKKLPENWEQKRKRVEWDESQEKKRKECEEKGEDFDRVKLLDLGADEAEKWERKKKKNNPDPGFSDYATATYRQYQRNTKSLKPDLENYQRLKEKLGDEVYATTSTLSTVQHKDNPDAVDKMVTDLEKQIAKREKFSRRRTTDEEADIDFINERNAKFNKKLERFYGTYTAEIKQNLERGTAV
ncbi:pre-mRNA-splicing factor SYF2-like isoform X2 [Mytilus edulis]|uniref:pre-mRNA-splicing factor SYF2-like isoform X2 n=2 Tax=Mytilus TaxID=6548 RepID=UPI0039F03A01